MARRPQPPEPQAARLSLEDMQKGVSRLNRRLKSLEDFDPMTVSVEDPRSSIRPYNEDIETALVETFGHHTIEYKRFAPASNIDFPILIGRGIPHGDIIQSIAKTRQRSIQLLQSAINLLNERIDEAQPASIDILESTLEYSNRVFIVHGTDGEPKEAVARFLSSLELEPIILHEQANRGRTIIQKFSEEAADVGFAIVLMTPDDQLGTSEQPKFRARQNVLFEMGFFIGALGPSRVATIVRGELERPSDYDGVVYIPYDASWKMALAKELEAAGYRVDWNKVMRR